MDKKEIAMGMKDLADLLCTTLEDVWENHTSTEIKEKFSLEELLNELQ